MKRDMVEIKGVIKKIVSVSKGSCTANRIHYQIDNKALILWIYRPTFFKPFNENDEVKLMINQLSPPSHSDKIKFLLPALCWCGYLFYNRDGYIIENENRDLVWFTYLLGTLMFSVAILGFAFIFTNLLLNFK